MFLHATHLPDSPPEEVTRNELGFRAMSGLPRIDYLAGGAGVAADS